jgi:hypothetical protein
MKDEFLSIVYDNIQRKGIENLVKWLEEGSDFYTAPASTKFHLSEESGLIKHSINVYNRLVREVKEEYGDSGPYSDETIAIVSLFHDLCKTNFYVQSMRNVKDEKGNWTSVPYYTIDDKLPMGHGEKSLYMMQNFMRLTLDEALAIRWHMGQFDDSAKGGSYSMNSAFNTCPLAVLLNMADLKATYLDEVKK